MKKFVLLVFVSLFVIQVKAAELLSHQLIDGSLQLTTDEGLVSITPYARDTFEVFYQPSGVHQFPSFAIADTAIKHSGQLTSQDTGLVFRHGELAVHIQKKPFRLSYFHQNNPLIAEDSGLFNHQSLRGFRFKLQDGEKLLGGGQRVLGMDRRGQRLPLYNRAHYGYGTESSQMYFSLPAVVSSNKYFLVFDNAASGYLDLGHNEADILQFEAVSGRTAYLIGAADSYPQLIQRYVSLTGMQPMPPRWALGNYASRFGYRSEAQTREVVNAFRQQDIPLDAVILDLYWFGKDIKGTMGNLDWDADAWPSPEKMLQDFSADGVKTILITEPFILTTSDKWSEAADAGALAQNLAGQPKRFDFYFGNTGLVDVFNPKAQDWFWQTYQRLLEQGVGGWWGDLGEPEVHPADTLHQLPGVGKVSADEIHNAYGHQWAKMLFARHRQARPNERPFIMMRSGFAGSQRYGMIPWTGDVSRSWDGLKPQVELALSMSMLGMAYTHSDLGGFAGGEQFDAELYTRWLQYGVFQPVYRPHAQEEIAPEPIFHDDKTKAIVRDFIKLRYALLPYNYSLSYQNSQTGMPMMRPLFFEDEQNLALMDNKDSYLWGDAFLVTPVVAPGVTSVQVTLPAGVWFDYFTGQRYSGGQQIHQPTHLETLPVLVRGGAFVPMVEPVATTRDYRSNKLTLHYYADKSVQQAEGQMYEDDGQSFDAVGKKQYELLHFSATQQEHRLSFKLTREAYQYTGMPDSREIKLVVHHWPSKPRQIRLNGEKVGFDYARDQQTLLIPFTWGMHDITLEVE
ncbi:TIM-barrel domain-containing protein [Bowmanella denitrificans]|uniref:glycoside hydrolase family 31 protein n=1 Tax=Bowmanella denitrificans TaxID=366582 RepID=UPI000C9A8EE3|nr:TIM-barrel domain-containing protein [Bowmanella denitrificans]